MHSHHPLSHTHTRIHCVLSSYQGRKRQVGLVLRLLRSDLNDSAITKLSEAVQQADRYNQPYSDSDVEQQLDVWVEALTGHDQVGSSV